MVEFKFEKRDNFHINPKPCEQSHIDNYYKTLRVAAVKLAGQPKELGQRAELYHSLYKHSHGNHTFPLIAAHGALWAKGYFDLGARLAKILAIQFILNPKLKREKQQQLENFAESFREINRQVCVETYIAYHMTDRFGHTHNLKAFFPDNFITALNKCHKARRLGFMLSAEDKRDLFEVFFNWEQDNIVHPEVMKAAKKLDWPLIKWIALKPLIQFRYFPKSRPLFFKNFLSKSERIEKGRQAFERAQRAGWDNVDKTLNDYAVKPVRIQNHTAPAPLA